MWANYKGQNNLVILIISLYCDNQAKMSSTFRKPNPRVCVIQSNQAN